MVGAGQWGRTAVNWFLTFWAFSALWLLYLSTPQNLSLLYGNINISLSFKVHEDPSFSCGDICKTIMTFVWSLIFYVFCMFSNLIIKIPSKCENYMKLVGTYGNYISKCPVISENMAPILAHMVFLNRSFSKMILYQSLWITLYIVGI